MYRTNYCEIDLDSIRHNVGIMRSRLQEGVQFLAVVKADAYGHGAVPVARAALEAGADMLAVAIPEEGIALRMEGIDAPILVLGGIALSVWNLPAWLAHFVLRRCGRFAVRFLVEYYLLMLLYGLLTVISEWSRIRCPGVKKILYCFTFPIFMLTYVPISITALFRKVSWTPIAHYGEEAARISR